MVSTSHTNFGANTEAREVAAAFAGGIKGKTVIVTGVNKGGIGFSTAEAFASQHPAHLIITGRSAEKLDTCLNALRPIFPDVDYRPLVVDLSSQQSVRKAAAEVLSWTDVPTIDILVNSAGIMNVSECTLTSEGIELHFATNHIGHYLFTCLIMPKLIASAKVSSTKGATRVINVTSGSPTMARSIRWSDPTFEKLNKDLPEIEQPPYQLFKVWGFEDPEDKKYVPLDGYNRSKIANVLFGIGLNHRLFAKYGILSTAVHPGVIKTELGRNTGPETRASIDKMAEQGMFTWKTLGAGGATSLVAALDPKLADGVGETKDGKENYGAFMMDCQVSDKAQPLTVSSSEAERLWALSEELVGEKFAW